MVKKILLQNILAILARATIRKYKPKIIGVTGSVGKTSTKEAIFTVLRTRYSVRTSEKNYNNEIGLPLTIIGIPYCGGNIFKWFLAILGAAINLVFRHDYPEFLVLEYGIDRPKDMNHLLSIVKPDIAVVTAIGEVPVHVEFFKDPEDVAKEKAKLVRSLSSDGYAILNHDDYAVYDMREKTKARTITYGFEEASEVRISNLHFQTTKDLVAGDIPEGITFKMEHGGHMVPFRLSGSLGKPHAYAAAAASAVGVAMGINLVEIAEAMKQFIPPPGRLRLLKGIRHSYIIDDTYNAAPEAMRKAIDTLASLPGIRKVAILGDMLEIGKYTEQIHRAIGGEVVQVADILITIGVRAKFIAEEAKVSLKKRRLANDQIFVFDDLHKAKQEIEKMIKPGDLLLVKGSQGMRMERIVEEIMAEPEKAGEMLVRQELYWKKI